MLEAAATRVYNTITLPTMSTGATDMAPLRARGVQCFGIGAAIVMEDGPKGRGRPGPCEVKARMKGLGTWGRGLGVSG